MKRSNTQFTEDEIIHLRQIIGEWVEQKELRGERTAAQLYEAIRDLPRAEGDRTRKTIMMDPRIGKDELYDQGEVRILFIAI